MRGYFFTSSPEILFKVIFISLPLAACGGGGGGGSGGTVSGASLPTTSVSAIGTTLTQSVSSNGTTTDIRGYYPDGAIISGDVTGWQVLGTLMKSDQTLSNSSVLPLQKTSTGQYRGIIGTLDGTQIMTVDTALNTSLGQVSLNNSYVMIGVKIVPGTAGTEERRYFSGAGGDATANMPNSGQATYSGYFQGNKIETTGSGTATASVVEGRTNLSANFSAGTISGSVNNMVSNGTTTGDVLTMNGTITGSNFGGVTSLTTPSLSSTVSDPGSFRGGFFGSGAAEAAGGISAVATSSASSSRKTGISGTFATKKN